MRLTEGWPNAANYIPVDNDVFEVDWVACGEDSYQLQLTNGDGESMYVPQHVLNKLVEFINRRICR